MSDGSSAGARDGSTGATQIRRSDPDLYAIPAERRSRWHRAGVKPRTAHIVDVAGKVVVLLLAAGWAWTIATTERSPTGVRTATATSRITSALTSPGAPTAAYLTDASLNALTGALRGSSGKLRAQITTAGSALETDSVPDGAALTVAESEASGTSIAPKAGVWRMAVAVGKVIKPLSDFNLISIRPRAEKQNGRVGLYYIGNWPGETGGNVKAPAKAPADRYRPPSGFIEVTRENADTKLSEHFTLRDFLTHDQPNVWPKYLVIELRNIDKLELVLTDLASRGVDVSGIKVMSGFRSPQYNAGGGNTGGRAGLSRHMYGDAADVYIDSDGNGTMDDLDHDGRITMGDSRVILQALDRVEAAHPELVGGGGVYPAAAGHGPFIHIDARGYRARWVGGPGGG